MKRRINRTLNDVKQSAERGVLGVMIIIAFGFFIGWMLGLNL
jgi:hypothetical protein